MATYWSVQFAYQHEHKLPAIYSDIFQNFGTLLASSYISGELNVLFLYYPLNFEEGYTALPRKTFTLSKDVCVWHYACQTYLRDNGHLYVLSML